MYKVTKELLASGQHVLVGARVQALLAPIKTNFIYGNVGGKIECLTSLNHICVSQSKTVWRKLTAARIDSHCPAAALPHPLSASGAASFIKRWLA